MNTVANDSVNDPHEVCFHCGLPVPATSHYSVSINNKQQAMCCPGCQAVAQTIVDNNLTHFYDYRTVNSLQAADSITDELAKLDLYDDQGVQKSFVTQEKGLATIKEAHLILEGIVCAACVWLNERHVSKLSGVIQFQVNYATHRARVKWDNSVLKLSDILKAIASIGYRAHPFDPGRQEVIYKKERQRALTRLAVAGLGAMQVMMLAIALYAGAADVSDQKMANFFRWISFLIATPVVFYSAQTFFNSAWRDIRRIRYGQLQLGMDVPVALAIGGAYLASVWATISNSGEIYFDSVTMFTFFLLAGRFLEMRARQTAGHVAEQLIKLLPPVTTCIRDQQQEQVLVADLQVGDTVFIKPGETIPADATIISGRSNVNESILTGESMPLVKQAGEHVIGGSVNMDNPLTLRVDKVGADTVLSSIQRLLDRAQTEKPQLAQLADRVAGYFVAGLLIIAALVALAWYQIDPAHTLWVVISVLVVTCPCALSLATPVALTAATGNLTRIGLLITRGHALETFAKVNRIAFDKTGTLTTGQLVISDTQLSSDYSQLECETMAATIEQHSEHPLARAFHHFDTVPVEFTAVQNHVGLGLEAHTSCTTYRIGNPEWVAQLSGSQLSSAVVADELLTHIALGDREQVWAIFYLQDEVRPDSEVLIDSLQKLGCECVLLSGDHEANVKRLARMVGIKTWHAACTPDDKLRLLKQWQQQGDVVAMVGDGVNDAPVLAQAQVSIAMGSGTQLAQVSSDMVLLGDRLQALAYAYHFSRKTLSVIKQNLAWAILYNIVALPMAAMGFVPPWAAAIGMSASSLIVVMNSLRLATTPAAET